MNSNKNTFQVQSVLGVVIFLVFSLFHFCAVTVKCPSENNHVEQWAYIFYTTYVKQKGMCTLSGIYIHISESHKTLICL